MPNRVSRPVPAVVKRAGKFVLNVGTDDDALDPSRRSALLNYDQGRAWHPASVAKRKHLRRLIRARGNRLFIESGTYLGDTIAFLRPYIDSAVSVELDEHLYARATRRFAGDDQVRIVHGDALEALPPLAARADVPPLVWLDGHYSTPMTAVGQEFDPAPSLIAEMGSSLPAGSTVVVDDLRLFGSDPDYPSLTRLVRSAEEAFPGARVRIGLDCLVIEA